MERDCANCTHLGRDCPKKLMLLPLDELIEWCQHIMEQHKITHEYMARISDVPKGTIDRVMAKQSADCRYSTIQAIVRALFEFLGLTSICLNDITDAGEAQATELAHRNAELEKALETSERDRQVLQTRLEEWAETRELMKSQLAKKDEHIDRLSNAIRGWRRVVKTLAILLGISVLAIIAVLVVDKLDPSRGFFWLHSMGG